MNPQASGKDVSKQLEFAKQQQQLRAFGNSPNFKTLSAESMIEDLLSKKETFQKRTPETQQKQDAPSWLAGTVPPLYERVWVGVQSAGGLADTPLLSSLLMSSGLSTDTLGYIWSLANHTVPGALIQSELYLVLALVGLAQTGYIVNNLAALHQLPQAPVPTLDLTLLPTRVSAPHVYPNPLNVTSLPDPLSTFNWNSTDKVYPNASEKIGISYVSSGPMISPSLAADQIPKTHNVNFTEFNTHDNISSNLTTNVFDSESKSYMKHSANTYSFSFPSLNESPSHVATVKPDDTDPFDDEFADFQSADFSSVTTSAKVENSLNSAVVNEDEFTNFQKAFPKYDNDDLSVLVVGGQSISSAQTLWVTDSPSISAEHETYNNKEADRQGISNNKPEVLVREEPVHLMKPDSNINKKDNIENKYLAFQEIDDDKYSVFHNPLPDDDDKQSVVSGSASESVQVEPKSIFSHSLFEDPESSLDLFKNDHQSTNLELPKLDSDSNSLHDVTKDNEEFSSFQNFSVAFPVSETESKLDKYDVFRTIVFEDNAFDSGPIQTSNAGASIEKNFQSFEAEMDALNDVDRNQENDEFNFFNSVAEKQNIDDVKFGDFQDSTVLPVSEDSNLGSLFSSLAISERNIEQDFKSEPASSLGSNIDKYKALRLIDNETVETDDFGEFFGAELPNSGNEPRKYTEQPSIQVRCLEACLNLLKAGLSTLSRASSQEVVSEILSDPQANNYLDCLLEVHRVSQRIISHMDSDRCVTTVAELRNVWNSLAPFFTHTEHTHLTESVGAICEVCRSNTGPSPVTFGAQTFHTPCANLYLHCVEPVLPNITQHNITAAVVQ